MGALKIYSALITLLVFLNSTNANYNTFDKKKQLLILEEIQKSIEKDFKLKGTIKKIIIEPDKNEKTVQKESTKRSGIYNNKTKYEPQKNTRGRKKIQEMLEKNRRKLREKQGASSSSSTGNSKIQQMLEQNRQKLRARDAKHKKDRRKAMMNKRPSNSSRSSDDWINSKTKEIENWQDTRLKEIKKWEAEKKKILSRWSKDTKRYKKEIPHYKKNLPPIPVPPPVKEKKKELPKKVETKSKLKPKPRPIPTPITKEVKMPVFEDYFVIEDAFSFEVRDQGRRPTCASFAGVRALEIMLARKNKKSDLSEQYFFWASKPKCQKSPCPKQGSWVLTEYKKSQNSSRPDIPLDRDCPYNKKSVSGNATQTPLRGNCHRGYAKVQDFSEVKSLPEIVNAIKNNLPVVGGFKLSKSFYKNNGYVFMKNKSGSRGKLDSHAAGHALLLVGYMKLPKKLHRDEGKFCLITANSWGTGWGKGGHACLSEKWINKYRYDMSFIALERVTNL